MSHPSNHRELLKSERVKLIPGKVKYRSGPLVEFIGITRSEVTHSPRASFLIGAAELNKPVHFNSIPELEDAAAFLKAAAVELREANLGRRGIDDV